MIGNTGGHGHSHGIVDPSIATSDRGLWAIKWSFVGLILTAAFQLVVVVLSNSVALLADTIHNLGDAATAIPLGIAFVFAKKPATRRFPYGFGRVEDLAGLAIVLTILASALVAGYQSIDRLLNPRPVSHLGAIIAASIVGFAGNELVAMFRIRVGREIGSAALIADGYHARTDGWTSLAVLFGAIGVYFGFPKADPVIGLLITIAILFIVWQSAKTVLHRMLDGVDAGVIDELEHTASHVPGVARVSSARARWIGHRMRAEVTIAVDPSLTVAGGHDIAAQVEQSLREALPMLSAATVHVDPVSEAHQTHEHEHVSTSDHPNHHSND
jgi:cation diffusion facilitator family transporter